MEVILQASVVNLGKVGDIVKVKPGYARNYLLPQNIALPVTEENKQALEAKRAALEKEEAKLLAAAKTQAESMVGLQLSLAVQANEEGHLFGAVSLTEIVELFTKQGHAVEKKHLHIAEGAIKELGSYNIIVQLHSEVKFELPLEVMAVDAEA